MIRGVIFTSALALLPAAAAAQVPRTDSTARADSAARADSIALVRELEAAQRSDTAARNGVQPLNTRLLPDISVVGDMIADLSPKRSSQESGARLGIREVEVAFQAAVDPYFRGDVFIGLHEGEGAAIEQAYLTATALPWQLEGRLGKFMMPVGKQVTTHRHDLHTIEYPYVIQRFFGAEGLKGTGLYASRVFSPFGFYQEVIGTVVDRFGDDHAAHGEHEEDELVLPDSPNDKLGGLGYSARLRNYFDLSQSANVEISFSGITGKRVMHYPDFHREPADGFIGRQTVVGADFTYRWRPLQQGLYRSFILQAEIMRQSTEDGPTIAAVDLEGGPITYSIPSAAHTGGYVFGRYQLSRRTFVGARYDVVDEPDRDATLRAASGYFTFFPSEFSKLVAGYERYMPRGEEKSLNRFILQATFALGPHKPHPF